MRLYWPNERPDLLQSGGPITAVNGEGTRRRLLPDADNPAAILITADRSLKVQKLAAKAGVQYLRKPVRPAALRAVLARASVQLEAAE